MEKLVTIETGMLNEEVFTVTFQVRALDIQKMDFVYHFVSHQILVKYFLLSYVSVASHLSPTNVCLLNTSCCTYPRADLYLSIFFLVLSCQSAENNSRMIKTCCIRSQTASLAALRSDISTGFIPPSASPDIQVHTAGLSHCHSNVGLVIEALISPNRSV